MGDATVNNFFVQYLHIEIQKVVFMSVFYFADDLKWFYDSCTNYLPFVCAKKAHSIYYWEVPRLR